MGRLPDFIIIGAMKSATSTLQEQLVLQPGIFMSSPKEPNFFSDDDVYSNGLNWYSSLFENAKPGDLSGEASTHYTKLPTYPETIKRLKESLPELRLIYVMRHPIDRLISHYIHEWSMGVFHCDINEAVEKYPELIPLFKRLAGKISEERMAQMNNAVEKKGESVYSVARNFLLQEL